MKYEDLNIVQLRAMWGGKLDQRCLACGVTETAGAYCGACRGRELEYLSHSEQPEGPTTYWCGASRGSTAGRFRPRSSAATGESGTGALR